MMNIFLLILFAVYSVHCNVTSKFTQEGIIRPFFGLPKDMTLKTKHHILNGYENSKSYHQNPADCADLLDMGYNKSGVYQVWPISTPTVRMMEGKSFYVYCDMDTNGGGWTVIQRRGDFKTPINYFYRNWQNYKNGFGFLEEDFWLGNENIFALTNQKLSSVRFDLRDVKNEKRFAEYKEFWIEDEKRNYILHIDFYAGDAGDSMYYHNNRTFSTFDRDTTGNCAKESKGGWWYRNCHNANLNGIYFKGKHTYYNGTTWRTWKGDFESLEWVEIKIRPKYFSVPFS